jgi:aldehyde:ferredoxin oxidoreductase
MDSEKFEQELPKNLEPLDTDKDLGFHTGLQTGSFPSAGKPLAIASHTSPTS